MERTAIGYIRLVQTIFIPLPWSLVWTASLYYVQKKADQLIEKPFPVLHILEQALVRNYVQCQAVIWRQVGSKLRLDAVWADGSMMV